MFVLRLNPLEQRFVRQTRFSLKKKKKCVTYLPSKRCALDNVTAEVETEDRRLVRRPDYDLRG